MVRTNAFLLNQPNFSHPYNQKIFKSTLGLPIPTSKPLHFVGFCSRNSEPKTITLDIQEYNLRVTPQQITFVNDSSKITNTFTIFKSEQDLSKVPSELLMAHRFEATLNRLSKWVVTGIFMGCLVWKYDGESLWMAMGSVVNYIVCITLKRVLKQERPVCCSKSDPGMPSSHAQSIFYILTSSILSIIERLGENIFTLTIAALALGCASYLSWLRVSQQYHTRSQVVVGGIVGSIIGILWVWAWHSFVFQAFLGLWWVRAFVIFGAATFFVGYLLYILHHMFTTQQI
ncbi:Phosphatidic acid phosphatase (PAP2) family protein [Euphorbia peplus]|nr:Phosphatidic acid phosphatase (PAP2) family protein [Euphorbia peplus]